MEIGGFLSGFLDRFLLCGWHGGYIYIYIYLFIICCGQYKGQRYVRSVVKWSFGSGGILVGSGQWWRGGAWWSCCGGDWVVWWLREGHK